MNQMILRLQKRLTGPGKLINSKTLNGLKVPTESINKTIQILEEKNLEKENKF